MASLCAVWPELSSIPSGLHPQLEADCRYASYVERQRQDIDALRRDESMVIPADLAFTAIGGLSAEAQDILSKARPETIGQANRLPGLTPAAIVAVLRHLKRGERGGKQPEAGPRAGDAGEVVA